MMDECEHLLVKKLHNDVLCFWLAGLWHLDEKGHLILLIKQVNIKAKKILRSHLICKRCRFCIKKITINQYKYLYPKA